MCMLKNRNELKIETIVYCIQDIFVNNQFGSHEEIVGSSLNSEYLVVDLLGSQLLLAEHKEEREEKHDHPVTHVAEHDREQERKRYDGVRSCKTRTNNSQCCSCGAQVFLRFYSL